MEFYLYASTTGLANHPFLHLQPMSSQAKHVRFAPDNIFYPPETSISAIAVSFLPSSSSTSSKSSWSSYPSKQDGLPGPTPYVFLRTPQPQLRETVSNRHTCHPFLETSAITYDFRDPISTVKTAHNHQRLSIETLRQSAFIPSLSHTTITSSYLPWTIKVYASNSSYITLQDVFSSIHSALRTNITPAEFHLLPSHHHRDRAIRAYQQRYRRLRHQTHSNSDNETNKESESEKRAGMKRVDFLMGHTKFLGISCKGCRQPNDEWNLHVASSTKEL